MTTTTTTYQLYLFGALTRRPEEVYLSSAEKFKKITQLSPHSKHCPLEIDANH